MTAAQRRVFLAVTLLCAVLSAAETPLDSFASELWVGKDNVTRSVLEEPGSGKQLRCEADFKKAPYAWVKRLLSQGTLDPAKHKALVFRVKGDEIGTMGVTLVYLDGKTEVKFNQELRLVHGAWKNVWLPFALFARDGVSITPAELSRLNGIMFAFGKSKNPERGALFLSGVALSDQMEARAMTNAKKAGESAKPVTAQQLADLARIKARLTETQVPELAMPIEALSESTRKNLETLREDGSWPDVNYDDRSRAVWAPSKHLDRVAGMAISFMRLSNTAGLEPLRQTLKDGVDRALAFWWKRDPQSDNWWHNMIGPQLTLQRIGLALDPVLTPGQRLSLVRILARGKTDGMTGGNLTWTAGATVVRGVLEGNAEVAARAFELIADEIRMAPDEEEGVKIDGSFHQHGQQIYNQGYGSVYAVDASRFLYYAAGTAFEFPKEKAEVLATYVLDGSRWMLWRNVFDYSGRGREITRPVKGFGTVYLAEVCKNLMQQATPRQAELRTFHTELTDRTNSLTGNRHFWKSDYTVHRRGPWMLSVKMLSVRMQSSELVNDEGRKSHLLSDGLTYLYSGDGQAYHNIFPIWDWKRLPGITAEWSPEPPKGAVPSRGETAFAGGVSDGVYGASGFIHQRGPVKALKSWFFFDEEAIALGSGICGGELPVFTSFDQSLKTGDIVLSEGGKERAFRESATFDGNLDWIHHRGFGFIPMEKSKITVKGESQTGSWKDISSSASPEAISSEVFSAWVDHGAKAKGATYRYLVVPTRVELLRAYAKAIPVRILENSEKIAAVEHPALQILQAVFYDASGVTSSDGVSVTTDGPCILMLRRNGAQWLLSVSQPQAKSGILGVTVSRRLSGKSAAWESGRGFTRLRVQLPEGDEAGKTVTESYELK